MSPKCGRAAVLVAVALPLLVSGGRAAGSHSPAGSGGCGEHTVVCYPECRWEWTGGTSVTTPDQAPCLVEAFVEVTNLPATQAVSGSVSVGNLPATQAITGTVSIGNEPTVHCLTGGNYDCRSTVVEGAASTEASPLFVKTAGDGGEAFDGFRHEQLFAMGALLFLVCSAWWMTAGRRGR